MVKSSIRSCDLVVVRRLGGADGHRSRVVDSDGRGRNSSRQELILGATGVDFVDPFLGAPAASASRAAAEGARGRASALYFLASAASRCIAA